MKSRKNLQARILFLVTFLSFSGAFASAKKPPSPKPSSTFSIKPYVFTIKGEKIAVAWSYGIAPALTEKIQLKLSTGTDADAKIITPVIDDGLYVAELPLPMCDFGDKVTYQVTEAEAPVTITNIPCAGHPQGLARFVFLADTQEGTEYAAQFAKLAADFKGSAVIIGGDLVQDGNKKELWVKLFDAMNPVLSQQVLIPGVGNHEYRFDKNVPLWKYFFRVAAQDTHYAMDIGDAHVIAINSCFEDDPSQKLGQLAWLEEELAKPARWKIMFFHHPPYAKGILNNPDAIKKEFLTVQRDYVPLFEKYNVDLVLNGHTHIFERSIRNGINYVVTGPGGGQIGLFGGVNPYSLMTERVRTMIELEVSHSVLRVTTTTIEGKTLDQFVLNKN